MSVMLQSLRFRVCIAVSDDRVDTPVSVMFLQLLRFRVCNAVSDDRVETPVSVRSEQ